MSGHFCDLLASYSIRRKWSSCYSTRYSIEGSVRVKTCAFWVVAEFNYNLNQVFGSHQAFHVFISKSGDRATAV